MLDRFLYYLVTAIVIMQIIALLAYWFSWYQPTPWWSQYFHVVACTIFWCIARAAIMKDIRHKQPKPPTDT